MIPRLALPPSPALLALILVAFALPGLAGHDPWRPFDVVGVEIVHQMHLSGDWLVHDLDADHVERLPGIVPGEAGQRERDEDQREQRGRGRQGEARDHRSNEKGQLALPLRRAEAAAQAAGFFV